MCDVDLITGNGGGVNVTDIVPLADVYTLQERTRPHVHDLKLARHPIRHHTVLIVLRELGMSGVVLHALEC
jgi:hypothetical protein